MDNQLSIWTYGWKYDQQEYNDIAPEVLLKRLEEGIDDEQVDIVIMNEWPDEQVCQLLIGHGSPYHFFYNDQLKVESDMQRLLVNQFAARPVSMLDLPTTINYFKQTTFSRQYGYRIGIKNVVIRESKKKKVQYQGNEKILIEHSYNEEWQQLATWRTHILTEVDKPLELWLEFELQGAIKLQIELVRIKRGSIHDIESMRYIKGKELDEPIVIMPFKHQSYVSVSVSVKGEGTVTLGNLHVRHSRLALGTYILGGQREVVAKRQEVTYYYHPGDLKPPLMVYFSGYRTAEGFEGYPMMVEREAPFILFTDPRLEGGSFYLNQDGTYQAKVVEIIEQHLMQLGWDKDALVLTGLSMGAFGALHYSTYLKPRAVVVGKPLLSLGTMALNEREIRPHGFSTSIDLLRSMEGTLDDKAIERMNQRYWEQFMMMNGSDTVYYIAYMKEDDYDRTAFSDLMRAAYTTKNRIIGKGFTGRHNDNSGSIIRWFLMQLDEILKQFDRG